MYIAYVVQQAERPMSHTQRRESDTAAGELAAAFATIGRSVKASLARRAKDNPPQQTAVAANDLILIPGDNLVPERDNELVSVG